MLKGHDDIGRRKWVSKFWELLFQYGYRYVWISQDFGDMKMFTSSFKQRITDCITQNLSNDVTSSTRCHTYSSFQTLFNTEKYLCIDLPLILWKSLARFRCPSHRLNKELVRHYWIDRSDRIYHYCLLSQNCILLED